jgi:hypothetical protein
MEDGALNAVHMAAMRGGASKRGDLPSSLCFGAGLWKMSKVVVVDDVR